MKKVMSVFGTRPEAIKMGPVIQALENSGAGLKSINVISSQHKDLLKPFLEFFRIRVDHDLDVMSAAQTPLSVLSRTMERLAPILAAERPDVVLVQGDTSTALGAALAAFHAGIPLGHIEAGLRSGNALSPFPEEMNRRLISRMATLNFAATTFNRDNLLHEGVAASSIHVTGNPVVDALQAILRDTALAPQIQAQLNPWHDKKLIVLTTHRRENFGAAMERNLAEIGAFVGRHSDLALAFPVHPNPNVRQAAAAALDANDRVVLLEPLTYPDFIHLLKRAWLIVSDSGGVQEEAPSLGRPLLVLRENTERPEGLASGTSQLVGGDPLTLRRMLEEAYEPESWVTRINTVANPFGDGQASDRIVQLLRTTSDLAR